MKNINIKIKFNPSYMAGRLQDGEFDQNTSYGKVVFWGKNTNLKQNKEYRGTFKIIEPESSKVAFMLPIDVVECLPECSIEYYNTVLQYDGVCLMKKDTFDEAKARTFLEMFDNKEQILKYIEANLKRVSFEEQANKAIAAFKAHYNSSARIVKAEAEFLGTLRTYDGYRGEPGFATGTAELEGFTEIYTINGKCCAIGTYEAKEFVDINGSRRDLHKLSTGVATVRNNRDIGSDKYIAYTNVEVSINGSIYYLQEPVNTLRISNLNSIRLEVDMPGTTK